MDRMTERRIVIDNIRAVLFDFDGTLLDSFPGHFRAYQVMFAHFGIPVTQESFFAVYSPNWLETYRRVGLPRERWDEADRVWMAEALRHAPPLFSGAVDVLAQLARRWPLGLVTSGSKTRVLGDLERTGLAGRFAVVVTGGDVQRPKPDPQGLELALAEMGVAPGEAVYVGDALADFEMASAAGVPFIGIPSQFASLTPQANCPQVSAISGLPGLLGIV